MSIEAKALLMNRVENSLSDKLTVTASNTALRTLSNELEAFEVEHVSSDVSACSDDLLKIYLSTKSISGLSPKSIEHYEYQICKMMDYVQVATREITVYHLRDFLDHEKKRGLSDNSLRGMYDVLCAYFNWLFRESLIERNPVVNLETIKVSKKMKYPYSDLEIELIFEHCKTVRDRAITHFLLSTGCRISEVTELNRSDVNLNTKECTVVGKGSKERKVFLDDQTVHFLNLYFDTRKDDDPALFIGLRGGRIQPGGVRAMLKQLEKITGIPNIHPHRFRRTLATRMAQRGAPIQTISLILGHEKLDTTMKYITYTTDNLKEAHARYNS